MPTYQEWLDMGSPEGSYDAYIASQQPQQPQQSQGGQQETRNPAVDEILNRQWSGNDPWKIFQDTSPEMLKQMSPQERAQWSRTHINGEYDQATWEAAQEYFDPKCPSRMPYRSKKGAGQAGVPAKGDADTSNCTEFPENSWKDKNGGQWGGWDGGNDGESYIPPERMAEIKASGGAGGAGGPGGGKQKPPEPTKVGNQISMTGDPMQDMLIQQFNTGQNATYEQNKNIFGLGEDRKVGGTGVAADDQSKVQGQSLTGGGIWWGQGNEAFGGWNAAEDKALAGVKQTREQKQAAKQYDPNAVQAANPQGSRPGETPPVQSDSQGFVAPTQGAAPTRPTTTKTGPSTVTYYAGGNMAQPVNKKSSRTIAGMVGNAFSGNA